MDLVVEGRDGVMRESCWSDYPNASRMRSKPWWRDAQRTNAAANAWIRRHALPVWEGCWREVVMAAGFFVILWLAYESYFFYVVEGALVLAVTVATAWMLGFGVGRHVARPGRAGTNGDGTVQGTRRR